MQIASLNWEWMSITVPIGHKSSLVQVFAWCWIDNKPLSDSPTHICSTQPERVKSYFAGGQKLEQFQALNELTLLMLSSMDIMFSIHAFASSHYGDVIIYLRASQIASVSVVCSTVGSGVDQRKHQSSSSLAFVQGIHRWPVNSPHKWPVTRKMFPFDDVITNHANVVFKKSEFWGGGWNHCTHNNTFVPNRLVSW